MMGNCMSNRAVLLIDMPKTWKVLGRQTDRQAKKALSETRQKSIKPVKVRQQA